MMKLTNTTPETTRAIAPEAASTGFAMPQIGDIERVRAQAIDETVLRLSGGISFGTAPEPGQYAGGTSTISRMPSPAPTQEQRPSFHLGGDRHGITVIGTISNAVEQDNGGEDSIASPLVLDMRARAAA